MAPADDQTAVKAEAGPEVRAQPAAAEAALQQAAEAAAQPAVGGADAAAAASGAEPPSEQLPQLRQYEKWRWRLLSFAVLPSECAPAVTPSRACVGLHCMHPTVCGPSASAACPAKRSVGCADFRGRPAVGAQSAAALQGQLEARMWAAADAAVLVSGWQLTCACDIRRLCIHTAVGWLGPAVLPCEKQMFLLLQAAAGGVCVASAPQSAASGQHSNPQRRRRGTPPAAAVKAEPEMPAGSQVHHCHPCSMDLSFS